jgi:hypothetical protein
MTKSADKNHSDSADIITHHRPPLKGGVCIVSAVSTREEAGPKPKTSRPRESRSKAHQAEGAGSDSPTQTPRANAQRPLSRAESPAEGQHTRTANYLSHYDAWISGMTEAELAQAIALGVHKPMPEDFHAHGIGLDADLAESKELSYSPDMASILDGEEPAAATTEDLQALGEKLWDVMRHLVGELLDTPNRSLTAECLAAVSGMSYTGDSITEIAKRHRVTRAAVSKRCVELTQKLKLFPSRTMRSLTARQAYRHAQRQLRNHDEI